MEKKAWIRNGITPGSISSCEDFIKVFSKCWGPPLERFEDKDMEIEETITFSVLGNQ